MHISLVAMPWALFDSPSLALGALCAWLRQERPQHTVTVWNAYLDVWTRCEDLYEPLSSDPRFDLLLLPLVFPEREEAVGAWFAQVLERRRASNPRTPPDAAVALQRILAAAREVVADLAPRLAEGSDLVGFTVTYAQLFGSLALAREIKRLRPEVRIVLGGAGVASVAGEEVMRRFPWVDQVVRGEGEVPLVALVDALAEGDPDRPVPGVLGRGTPTGQALRGEEVPDLDRLPLPDFDAYAARAEELSLYWVQSLEASRGCWWHRVSATGNPLRACHFCGLNAGRHREKSADRVGEEVRTQVRRYRNVRVRFVDNAMRREGIDRMVAALTSSPMDLQFFAEVRASISPRDLLRLQEAGCDAVQIGVEGLSTAYLRRLGKGTTTIQNLQAMKTCWELGIPNRSNLLTHFPGTPQAEVDEMARTILDHAIAFEPLSLSRFVVAMDSGVARLPERFGVTNLRPDDDLTLCLPPEARGLHTTWLASDPGPQADWTPVERAVEAWNQLHAACRQGQPGGWRPLTCVDGGDFLEIADRRQGFRLILLETWWRELYLACHTIRLDRDLLASFGPRYGEPSILEALEALHAERLVYRERGRTLALAPAANPRVAARRIRGEG